MRIDPNDLKDIAESNASEAVDQADSFGGLERAYHSYWQNALDTLWEKTGERDSRGELTDAYRAAFRAACAKWKIKITFAM